MSQVRTVEQVTSSSKSWAPVTAADRKAVREQLDRILASPRFGKSRRCPILFRYIVSRALNGDTDSLKERTLGIQVFGRDPDYDTNADPIVRTTAGEIRKRIAQYYHESGHEHELRIDLPSGSYVPEFHLSVPTAIAHVASARPKAHRWAVAVTVVSAAAVMAVLFIAAPWKRQTALESFWQPVTSSETPVLLCVGPPDRRESVAQVSGENDPARSADKAPTVFDLLRIDSIPVSDSITLARVSRLLGAHGRAIRVQSMAATTRADVQSTPAVMIGAFNNDWTIRVSKQLRYGFEADWKNNSFRIVDRLHPQTSWRTDMTLPYTKLTEDHAIVARFINPFGDRFVVVAAGLGQYGTLAAGEFLTDPKYMDKFAKSLPAGWQQKNIEAVISARVIDGNGGPPQPIAFTLW